MPYTQHFIIEGRYLGACDRRITFAHAEAVPPLSFAYVCPVCGELWARAAIEGRQYMVWTLPCRKHPTHRMAVPGSILLTWEPELFDALPAEVVEWEFQRHLDYAERNL